ncbi:beta-glucuronidase-like [Amphibalanus amphitrite]|uniref:beta-glucuronidase-like n=1 Tax=Amphibalanus amphitrite TaxID=1232801 RepID=UPI001C910EB2|nr:beta-glucuronidase-like [Amphibalanus amphitrite]
MRSLTLLLALGAAGPLCADPAAHRPAGAAPFAGLPPQDSEWREVRSLDGLWQFKLCPTDDPERGFREQWFAAMPSAEDPEVLDMPVPASYNDITQRADVRDHLGWAWYWRQAWVPRSWAGRRTVLRVGSAHYSAVVYVNGARAAEHSGGHLPFAADVTDLLLVGQANLVSIAVNNTLTDITVPQGRTVRKANSSSYVYPEGYETLEYNFDFFNYAGLHRPVLLYTTADTFVEDVTVTTTLAADGSAAVTYAVTAATVLAQDDVTVNVTLTSPGGEPVGATGGAQGVLTVAQPELWWPYLMDASPGRQYTLIVELLAASGARDIFRQRFGIREITWDADSVSINGRPVYIRGFGKHEDSDIRGKGLDLPLLVKDFNLIEWLGANCFRTSHYPYAEEIMDAADARGIMVIDETPAVSLDYSQTAGDDRLLTAHTEALSGLIARDKNRPSVLMWSLSNEAKTGQPEAVPYYQTLVALARAQDGTRPVTAVLNTYPDTELVAPLLDVILVNRYFGWYSDTGHSELIDLQARHFLTFWRDTFGKPVVQSEYGADTVAGLHQQPTFVFTEEYQTQLMAANFRAFEAVRAQGWFVGEMIWNFADFMTKQDTTRVVGNRKGVLTRQRQPKMSAHLLRSRYWALAQRTDMPELLLPDDLMFSGDFTGVQKKQCPARPAAGWQTSAVKGRWEHKTSTKP